MKFHRIIVMLISIIACNSLWGITISKNQVLYLMQAGQIKKGVDLYKNYVNETGKHDFSILEQMSYIILNQGASSTDEEVQLLSMYGANIAGVVESMSIYDIGMSSSNPMIQLATIQFLSQIQDDRAEEILYKAYNSPFLPVRMEASYALANRKSERAPGIIDSLMKKLPSMFWVYFPDLFAMIGSMDAMGVLQRLMGDKQVEVRLAAILAAAKFGRDDFLSYIRSGATHSDQGEQETCAMALGHLKDSNSISQLKILSQSPHSNVKLAASQSLYLLGDHSYSEEIIQSALKRNPFAISLLVPIPHSENILFELLKDYNVSIRVNAALALLNKRNPSCIPVLMNVLLKDEKDLGLIPQYSLGRSLIAWKVIYSSTQYAKQTKQDVPSVTLSLREQILQNMLELGEEDFLRVAREIFEKKQHDLVPLLIHLLENLNTPNAVALLEDQSKRAGVPFIRTYCHFALYRLKAEESHGAFLFDWIKGKNEIELIRFRPVVAWTSREGTEGPFILTPQETSMLLIEAFSTLAQNHDPKGIDLLIDAISEGHEKNRYVISGLLLKAIQ